MSNYVKATNFTAKDSLPSGNSGKIIKGTEIDVELTAVASAITSKADSASPTFTGTPLAPTAAAGTSNTQIATTAFVATAVTNSIPSGGIIMWSGSIGAIPSGWYLCNGSNGTPDLRDKFIAGAGNTYAIGATGGSADATNVAHTHTFSVTSGAAGGHTHDVMDGAGGTNTNSITLGGGNFSGQDSPTTWRSSTTYTLIQAVGDHTHSVSGTTASTGSSATNANLPPYYALAYIMKA